MTHYHGFYSVSWRIACSVVYKWKVATGFFCCRWCLFHQRVDRRVPAWTFSRHRPAVVGYPRVACATDTCSCCENQYFYAIWLCFVRRQQPTTYTYISDKNRVSQTGTNVLEWEKQWPKWPREIIGILYAGNFWNLTFSGTSCINHHCEKACYIPMYKKGWSRSRSGLIFCRMKILTKPRKKLKIAMLLSQWGQSATQSLDAVRLSFTMWQLIFAGIDTHLYNIWTFTVIVSVHSWQWAA